MSWEASKDNDNILYCFGRSFYSPNKQLKRRFYAPGTRDLVTVQGSWENTTPHGINKPNIIDMHMNKYICKLV